MKVDDFLDRLDGVKPAGNGYVAICPSHDDAEASLGIAEGDEGILLNCYAGCDTQKVLDAMGLEMRDLFYRQTNYSEPEAIYQYRDEMGTVLFEAVRFPGKKFKQRHQGPDAEWVWNLQGVRRVLYRLPEIIEAVEAGQTIYVCEGEKDVHALLDQGFQATCNPMGAGKWRPEFAEYLTGANVVIVADRDEPGRNHAENVKNSLVGKARGIWVVQAKRGKDAHDHLVVHHLPVQDLVPLRERTRRGVITSAEAAEAAMERLELGPQDLKAYAPLPITSSALGELKFRAGRPYLLGGYTGDGKTALALQATAGLAGARVPTGYFSMEMTEEDLMNRLVVQMTGLPLRALEEPWSMTSGQRDAYVQAVEEIRQWPLDIIFDTSMTSEKILEATRNGEYEFVVIDHIHRFGKWKERREFEDQIAQITNLALEHNIPVLVLAQLRRFMKGKDMEVYPRPMLQDFRETEMLGAESAMAMAIWRVRHNGVQYDPSGVSELLILKNRHGATGSYFLNFNGPQMTFGTGGTNGQRYGALQPPVDSGPVDDPESSEGSEWYEAS